MTDAPSATTIAQPFVAAVTETFGSLLGLEAIGSAVDDALTDDAQAREGISALIEFSGPRFGVVLVTFSHDAARATVERMNMVKRHRKGRSAQTAGGIIEKEAPLHLSNLMLVCDRCNKPTRGGSKILDNGKVARRCHRCGEVTEH